MLGNIDLNNIKKLTKVQTEYPQSVCGNKHIYTLIKDIILILKYNTFLYYWKYWGKKLKKNGGLGEKELLTFLNIPVKNIKHPISRRYLYKTLTEKDKTYIQSHEGFRRGLPFLRKSLLARDMLNTIQKIIEINSPLAEETQKQIVHLILLVSQLHIDEESRFQSDKLFFVEKEKEKRRKGGLKKGKNAELFKEKMYEEQKEWFYERRAQRKSRYAVDFARRYYKKCKEEYEKDNTIKFPFHFTEGAEIEDDNAFAYLTRAAQKNNKKIIEEYMKN